MLAFLGMTCWQANSQNLKVTSDESTLLSVYFTASSLPDRDTLSQDESLQVLQRAWEGHPFHPPHSLRLFPCYQVVLIKPGAALRPDARGPGALPGFPSYPILFTLCLPFTLLRCPQLENLEQRSDPMQGGWALYLTSRTWLLELRTVEAVGG